MMEGKIIYIYVKTDKNTVTASVLSLKVIILLESFNLALVFPSITS